jgi:hypothetical protein
MSIGSNNIKKFNQYFQIRWCEKLGIKESPYLIRWTLVIFGYTIRLHHWIKSDDKRFFHDHACDLISIIIKGYYYNVMPDENGLPVKHLATAWKIRRMKATQLHYLDIPNGGAWTILLCGRPYQKWGFIVNGHKWRPLRYFHKYGIIQTIDYQ